jgi:hypothetical protein
VFLRCSNCASALQLVGEKVTSITPRTTWYSTGEVPGTKFVSPLDVVPVFALLMVTCTPNELLVAKLLSPR